MVFVYGSGIVGAIVFFNCLIKEFWKWKRKRECKKAFLEVTKDILNKEVKL